MQTENGMGREDYLIYIVKTILKSVTCSSQQGIMDCQGKNNGKNSRYVL